MLTFKVAGMSCGHCAAAIADAVHAIDSMAKIAIGLNAGRVEVDTQAGADLIARAIEGAGYEVIRDAAADSGNAHCRSIAPVGGGHP